MMAAGHRLTRHSGKRVSFMHHTAITWYSSLAEPLHGLSCFALMESTVRQIRGVECIRSKQSVVQNAFDSHEWYKMYTCRVFSKGLRSILESHSKRTPNQRVNIMIVSRLVNESVSSRRVVLRKARGHGSEL